MNRAVSPHGGYTIVETLIFLAVSGMLFISAMALVSGQRQRTEFVSGMRDINSQIQDVINDVATGFYSTANNLSCTHGPIIVSGASQKGTQAECIFVGRAIGFGISGDPNSMQIYNIVGNRTNASGVNVSSLDEANPTVLKSAMQTTTQVLALPAGITIGCMTNIDGCAGGGDKAFGAVGFLTVIDTVTQSSGVNPTSLVPIPNTNWDNQDVASVESAIDGVGSATPINPAAGTKLCFSSAGSDQHAFITIGGSGKLTTVLEIHPGKECNV